jgi:hypothetical protein
VETKILSRIGAGRSQLRRTDLIGSFGKLLFCLLLAGSFLLGQAPAQVARAAGIVVSCGDSAGLISAIQNANSTTEPDMISLAAGCMYTLTALDNHLDGKNGLPNITTTITIDGNGATIARASSAPHFRIFHIGSGGSLTLNNLTVSNGLVAHVDEPPGDDGSASTGGGA